jgi:hypothetical protein
MVRLDFQQQFVPYWEMVDCIVNCVVNYVTQYKASKKRQMSWVGEYGFEEVEEEKCKRNANRRGHHKP